MAKQTNKKRAFKGWMIALSIIALIVLSVVICVKIGSYSPNVNYYGNGTTWSSTDNFDEQ